jgi:hypothetical protein
LSSPSAPARWAGAWCSTEARRPTCLANCSPSTWAPACRMGRTIRSRRGRRSSSGCAATRRTAANRPASTRGWLGQPAYIDAAHRVHARVEDAILLRGSSGCRMTLRGTVANRTPATHPLAVVHVFFAAQKLSHGRPATCATLPGLRTGSRSSPLPARSSRISWLFGIYPQRIIRTGKDCGIGDPAPRDGVAPRQVV